MSNAVKFVLAVVCGAHTLAFGSEVIELENLAGSIAIHSAMGLKTPEFRVSSPLRSERPGDVEYIRLEGKTALRCLPSDGMAMTLHVSVPHTATLRVRTSSGAISLVGLVRSAALFTSTGSITITGPTGLMQVRIVSGREPASTDLPTGRQVVFVSGRRNQHWVLADVDRAELRRPVIPAVHPIERFWSVRRIGTYSSIEVHATAPKRISIIDAAPAPDSWIRPLTQATQLASSELRPRRATTGDAAPSETARDALRGFPVFSSNVRLVTLAVAVHEPSGRLVPGLIGTDFEVLEDRRPQAIAFARSEELAVDLVLLLDLSDSTLPRRDMMKLAARGFVDGLRPGDRLGIYALAENLFQVVSPLTSDRSVLHRHLDSLPVVSGSTPLYDAIALSYAQELLHRNERRSALVVLSDGLDTSLAPHRMPGASALAFRELKRIVAELPVLVYPILLPTAGDGFPHRGAAAKRMRELAEATGGESFAVGSIGELELAYGKVAEQLRSTYTIGYYPANQDFDGRWREITVRVPRLGITPRGKRGYYAR